MVRPAFMMNKKILILTSFLSIVLTPCVLADDRPNILFIMSDDHTTQAFKTYSSRLAQYAPTPNIHKIAQQGAVAENVFVTNSICVPSRATILTGQYSHKNNVYTLRDRINPNRRHIGHIMQDNGYQTVVLGKWHLKSDPSGFDYWEVLPQQGRYFDPVVRKMDGSKKTYEGFSADVFTTRALDWLKNKRNSNQPSS